MKTERFLKRVTVQFSLLLILIGLIIALITLFIKPKPEDFIKLSDIHKLLYNFFELVGFSLFTSGIFSIFLQLADWRQYFEERLKSIVLEQSYLNSLDNNSLSDLQTRTLKAFFKTSDIDKEGSFLKYFQENLNQYIRLPYRENVHTEIIIEKADRNGVWIHDRVYYNCRMVGDKIQKAVRWKPDKDEFLDVESLSCTIRSPSDPSNPKVIAQLTKVSKTTYTLEILQKKNSITFKEVLSKGVEVSLEPFNEDGLLVELRSRYKMEKQKFSNWAMAHPTKNFNISIIFPDNFKIRFQPMVLHPEKAMYDEKPGFLRVSVILCK